MKNYSLITNEDQFQPFYAGRSSDNLKYVLLSPSGYIMNIKAQIRVAEEGTSEQISAGHQDPRGLKTPSSSRSGRPHTVHMQ